MSDVFPEVMRDDDGIECTLKLWANYIRRPWYATFVARTKREERKHRRRLRLARKKRRGW